VVNDIQSVERRRFLVRLAGVIALAAPGRRSLAQLPSSVLEPTPIRVWKSSTCTCCKKWVDHIRANGFALEVHDEEEMEQVKDELGVPAKVRSCHTAQVGSYLIEGHVPASDIRRVLKERPKIAGLAVPEMPPLTPGMAPPDTKPRDFEVLSFLSDGTTRSFARH
jgi:hypothetical protein